MNLPEQIPMFDGPEFCPIMPPRGSAAEQALYDLLARDLTQIDWLKAGHGWRLAARIKELDYLGWEPQSVRIQYPGYVGKIALYSLTAKAKQAAHNLRQRGGDEHA